MFFVNHSTAPVSLGGAERSLLALVEYWYQADEDFEAFFITKHPRGQFTAALDERGWSYESMRFRGWAGPRADPPAQELAYFARQDYAAVSRCIRLMEERRPDLVVTNTLVAPWGAFAAKVLDIPHAWMVREYGDLDHGLVFTGGRDATLADIGLLSDVVFTNSEGLRDHLAPHIPGEKLAVVYPQIDVDAVVTAARERPRTAPFPGGRDGDLLITCVGRLLPGKGQALVIDALAAVAGRDVPARLCLVGSAVEAEYRQSLADLAIERGVGDRVTFVGEQQNPFPFVAAADVCITASDIEAFGRTTAEYLALGKPVVAFRNGGSLELVVDGVTGMLVDPTADAIADALTAYAGDADLRARHGGAGHLHVRDLLARHDHVAAVDRLRRTAAAGSGYRLPQIARHWFAIPGIVSEASARGITLRFVLARGREAARRLVRRVRRAISGPPKPQPRNPD